MTNRPVAVTLFSGMGSSSKALRGIREDVAQGRDWWRDLIDINIP